VRVEYFIVLEIKRSVCAAKREFAVDAFVILDSELPAHFEFSVEFIGDILD
jgi:hypothetical protein